MFVFELEKPGTWLAADDHDLAWRVSGVITHLEGAFFEINLALNLFESERRSQVAPTSSIWEEARDRRAALVEQLRRLSPDCDYGETYYRADILAKREAWELGQEPAQFTHHRIFLHARSFLFSLDMFGRFLAVLEQEATQLAQLSDLNANFEQAFPDVRGVRNTTAHPEDRARGLGAGRTPKPMQLAPVENGAISAPNGALILNCLNGNRYGATMASGLYGEVEVSPSSVRTLQDLLLQAYGRFLWHGPKQHLP